MANHAPPDPAVEALVLSASAEATRAVRYHEERLSTMKDRRALGFLAGAERDVRVAAMAAAAGVSHGLVASELTRARKMAAVEAS